MFWVTNEEITHRNEPLFYQADALGTIIDMATAHQISLFLKTNYGFDPGAFGEYTIYSKSNKFFNRIDWNISDKH